MEGGSLQEGAYATRNYNGRQVDEGDCHKLRAQRDLQRKAQPWSRHRRWRLFYLPLAADDEAVVETILL